MKLWSNISKWGTKNLTNPRDIRYVVLCNKASMLVSLFSFLLCITAYLTFGWLFIIGISLACALALLFPLLLNYWGWIRLSRLLFSVILSIICVVVSVVDKLISVGVEDMQYYEFRLLLLSASIFPFILFAIEERKYWFTAIMINLSCIALFDSAHSWFNVGYHQNGFTGENYFFINFMMVGAFLIIVGSAFFLKNSFEKADLENEKLIQELSHQRSEVLKINHVIEEQREALVKENSKLNVSLIEKNNQLIKTNQELVQHNNDLQQFSYTISHNLRGPVASINGLLNLLHEDEFGARNKELLPHFRGSIASLDHTIRDLSNIIDVRNGLSRVRETIVVREEIRHILTLLNKELEDNQIVLDIQVADDLSFVSVKSMVSSILHNLISNAIKYKSPDRPPKITVQVKVEGDFAQLMVSDNGLGIDLQKYRDKLFGIYKRFHSHVDGKGLGLFLVKLQAESLGGHVDVTSTPGAGTTFRIFIRVQDKPE